MILSKTLKSALARRSVEEVRGFEGADFLGHGNRDELVDAGSILPAQAFHRVLERLGQAQDSPWVASLPAEASVIEERRLKPAAG